MQVWQLVHTLSYGDAISTEVLAIDRCLKADGHESYILALNTHPAYQGRTVPPEAMGHSEAIELEVATDGCAPVSVEQGWKPVERGLITSESLVILHYSIGSPLNDLFRSVSQARRCLIYHNITPAAWFRGINPRVAKDIARGVEELSAMCALSDVIWADSAFNATEIGKLGYKADELRLLVEPTRWQVEANAGITSLLRDDPSYHLLHVGRIAPNKCIEDILKVFYFFHHYVEPKSILWLVGIDTDTELYSFALKQFAYQLGIADAVRFLGALADSEVRAFYEGATAYLCMSEHEGFCLPVLEAMEFGLPVVGFDGGAVGETLGSGGILFKEKNHAHLAELLHRLRPDSPLRTDLIAKGRARAKEFSPAVFAKRLRALLGEIPARTPD